MQKDNVAGATNVDTSIRDALDSITDAAADKRYVVKIMPGTYTVSVPLQLKAFVDIEGSGPSTVITSTIAHSHDIWDDLPTSNQATLIAAENTRISNLKVTNTSNSNGVALLIKDPKVQVENVIAEAVGTGDDTYDYFAICVHGNNVDDDVTEVVLQNVTAYAAVTGTDKTNNAVAVGVLGGAKAEIIHTKATSRGGKWNSAIQVCGKVDAATGTSAVIRDSQADAGVTNYTGNGNAAAIGSGNTQWIEVHDSTAWAHDTNYQCDGMKGVNSAEGSVARATGCTSYTYAVQFTNIAGSMIDGDINYSKVTNCWDENLDPLANQ